MESERDRLVKEIFADALEKASAVERAAFLARACGADARLRQEVEALLQAYHQAGAFLEEPALVPADNNLTPLTPLTEKPGDWIGHYRLLQEIGEGGFGVVYVAEQKEPVRRRVALKLVKPGMDTRAVIGRFEAERQALALMDHPNIATVFDAGATETGRPYFVMELVPGVRITDYCDEHCLSTTERLGLFIQVCHAIQHAHQKGIIHRDLKPSNILVTLQDGLPVPKVIDFGIAKATGGQALTDKTVYTALDQFLGTPTYTSPEQAHGGGQDIDTRSDIYNLGVLLYELLTGHTPFEHKRLMEAGLDELRRILREEEPARPSTRLSLLTLEEQTTVAKRRQAEPPALIHLVRGDLDWIVMKCLEKDRNRRYDTANGLAQDIQSHLRNEPVVARPQSRIYRLGKLITRNKVAFTAGAAIALALVLGTLVSTWEAVRASRARRAAVKAEKEAKAVLGFFQDKVLVAARPEGDGGLGHNVSLPAAIAAAEPSIASSFTNQPEVEASIRDVVGQTYYFLGELSNAVVQLERTLALRKAALGPDHPDTIWAMDHLAFPLLEAGRYQEALKLCEETLRLKKAKLGLHDPQTLTAMDNLVQAYQDVGRWDEALKLSEQTVQLMTAKHGPDHPDTLAAVEKLATCYDHAGRSEQALKLREQAFRLSKAKVSPVSRTSLSTMAGLANSYHRAGRYEEAIKLHEQVLQLSKANFGAEDPPTLIAMGDLAISYYAAAEREQLKHPQEALKFQEEALKLREQVLALTRAKMGPNHRHTLVAMDNLAASYGQAGHWQEALQLLEQTVQSSKTNLGPQHPSTLNMIGWLALSYRRTGRLEEALQLSQQRLQLIKASLGLDNPETLSAMNQLADSYFEVGRLQEAVKVCEQLVPLAKARLGPDHPDTRTAIRTLAFVYGLAGRPEEALPLREQLFNLSKARLGPEHPETLIEMDSLAAAYNVSGRSTVARKLYVQLLPLVKAKLGPTNALTGRAVRNFAAVYYNAGQYQQAMELYRQAVPLLKTGFGPDALDTLTAMAGLAASYYEAGRLEDALNQFEELRQLSKTKLGGDDLETRKWRNLARCCSAVGRDEEALQLREQAFQRVRGKSGAERADALSAMKDLAASYGEAGRGDEALQLREQALRLSKATLGPEHVLTFKAMGDLAISYFQGGCRKEALQLREQVVQGLKAKLSPEHLDTLIAMKSLAGSYRDAGRAGDSINLDEQALQMMRTNLGPEHPETLALMHDLALSYREAGRPDEAIKLLEQTLQLRQATLRPGHPNTLRTMESLAKACAAAGRQEDALKLHRQMLEFRKARLGPALGLYPRSESVRGELLDLSASFDAGLKEAWQNLEEPGDNLSLLPHGLQTLSGVRFDVRGIVQLQSKALDSVQPEYPERVEGIPVGQKCHRLNFLQGAGGTNAEGVTIARYLVHYSDEQKQEVPVRYGREVLCWHQAKDPPGKALVGPVVAWEGSQARWANQPTNCIRLYRMTWENPRPDVPIETLDFVSAMEEAAPFLIAVTVE